MDDRALSGRGRRVLFLTSSYPRWDRDPTSAFLHDLAVDLTGRGWRITVLAPHAPGVLRHEVLDGVELHRFRYAWPERAQRLCYGGGAIENFRTSRRARVQLPGLIAAEWWATARALTTDVDVLHAHWTLPQGFVAAITPRRRVPRILTVHGSDVLSLRGRRLDRVAGRALRAAALVTANSAATAAAARDIGGPRLALATIPFGIDLERRPAADDVATLRARFGGGAGPLLVFVGRLIRGKGVYDIVSAAALLSAELPELAVAFVGDGPEADGIRLEADRLGIASRIHLIGRLEPAEVPAWYAAADAVVAPSLVEGQGLSIIEAMAAGALVIAARTGGVIDTISDGANGLLVPPGDPAGIAAAVRRVVYDPQEAARMADRGRESVGRFSRAATANRMAEAYEDVLARGPARRPC